MLTSLMLSRKIVKSRLSTIYQTPGSFSSNLRVIPLWWDCIKDTPWRHLKIIDSKSQAEFIDDKLVISKYSLQRHHVLLLIQLFFQQFYFQHFLLHRQYIRKWFSLSVLLLLDTSLIKILGGKLRYLPFSIRKLLM